MRLLCKIHEGQEVNYICMNTKCLLELCKFCANDHDSLHHAMEINDSFSQMNPSRIKNFEEAKHFTSKYLRENITFLGFELEKIDEYFLDFESFLGKSKEHKDFLAVSSHIITIVKKYLKDLEKDHRRKIAKVYEGYLNDLKEIKDRILKFKTGIVELNEKVNASKVQECVDIVKSVFKADYKSDLNVIASKSKEIFQNYSKDNNESFFQIDQYYEKTLRATLSNLARIGKRPKEESMLSQGNLMKKNQDSGILKSTHSLFTEEKKPSDNHEHAAQVQDSIELDEHAPKFKLQEKSASEYFNESARYKALHFFNHVDNTLEYVNLNEEKLVFNKVKFYSQSIPMRHRSLITPSGQIIMIGGVLNGHCVKNTFVFRWANKDLQDVAMMKKARKSPSICFLNNYVYAFGGVNSSEGFLKYCERYNVVMDEWEQIEDMPKGMSSAGCCPGPQESIFLIGGLCGPRKVLDNIYQYSVTENTWKIKYLEKSGDDLCKLFWLSAALFFDSTKEIMVFGGIDERNQSQDTTYRITSCEDTGFFKMTKDDDLDKAFMQESTENRQFYQLFEDKELKLPNPGGFWCSLPILFQNKFYFLQNIVDDNDKEKALEDKRRVLILSDSWKVHEL